MAVINTWSAEEEETLRQLLAQGVRPKECAARLGRTEPSTRGKIHYMRQLGQLNKTDRMFELGKRMGLMRSDSAMLMKAVLEGVPTIALECAWGLDATMLGRFVGMVKVAYADKCRDTIPKTHKELLMRSAAIVAEHLEVTTDAVLGAYAGLFDQSIEDKRWKPL